MTRNYRKLFFLLFVILVYLVRGIFTGKIYSMSNSLLKRQHKTVIENSRLPDKISFFGIKNLTDYNLIELWTGRV